MLKYELEATAGAELLNSLNEFHIASALNYASYQNQVSVSVRCFLGSACF